MISIFLQHIPKFHLAIPAPLNQVGGLWKQIVVCCQGVRLGMNFLRDGQYTLVNYTCNGKNDSTCVSCASRTCDLKKALSASIPRPPHHSSDFGPRWKLEVCFCKLKAQEGQLVIKAEVTPQKQKSLEPISLYSTTYITQSQTLPDRG